MTRSGTAIITAAVLVFVVGACGSSNSSTSNNPAANSSDNASGGNGSFADLIGKAESANAKITYKTDKNGDDFTLIRRGDDSVYKSGDTAIYNVGGKTTSCEGAGST